MLKHFLEVALRRFVSDNRYENLDLRQIEAYTDLLTVGMVIDHHIAQSERDAVTELLARFPWPEHRPSDHFVNQSVRRAWGLLEAESRDAATLSYCKEISARLKEDWLRENAFLALVKVIHADSKLEPVELQLLDLVREAFDIEPDLAEELIARGSKKPEPSAPPNP